MYIENWVTRKKKKEKREKRNEQLTFSIVHYVWMLSSDGGAETDDFSSRPLLGRLRK